VPRDLRIDYPVELYHSTLTVLVVKSLKNISSKANKLGLDDDDTEDFSLARGLTWELPFLKPPRPGASCGRWVIALRGDVENDIVAHEATHAGLMLALWHGLPVSADPELQEPLAYVVGWASECAFDALDRYHRA